MIRYTSPDNHIREVHSPALFEQPTTLRVSVTDRCNFRCKYCLPDELHHKVGRNKLPSLDQLFTVVKWLTELYPITKIKLTGGEPLVRRGLDTFIRKLAKLPSSPELSMTTNGSLLLRYATVVKSAGLSRVNVSLDSLNPGRFRDLTHGGNLQATLEGIDAAVRNGLTPLKLNTVIFKSTWLDELPLLIKYAQENDFELRLIELMRTGTTDEWIEREFISAGIIKEWLLANGELCEEELNPVSPARKIKVNWNGKPLNLGFITPLSHPFCSTCIRIRLEAMGNVRRCLMDEFTYPLLTSLESKESEVVHQEFVDYMSMKTIPQSMQTNSNMKAVGG
ncbi:radical SAM protein [bacterium]|nr:radical SAM protein [bacterium]